jgi:hypothetical protein
MSLCDSVIPHFVLLIEYEVLPLNNVRNEQESLTIRSVPILPGNVAEDNRDVYSSRKLTWHRTVTSFSFFQNIDSSCYLLIYVQTLVSIDKNLYRLVLSIVNSKVAECRYDVMSSHASTYLRTHLPTYCHVFGIP